MRELEEFIEMSKYAGERFDLVQAGGGNTSVKLSTGEMYIKASGYLLSEVDKDNGYTIVENSKVLRILEDESITCIENKKQRDSSGSIAVSNTILQKGSRPSIETFLHALLLKYTLHVHSISVNVLTSHKNWREKVMLLGDDILPIKYETPGIDLAIELKNEIEVYLNLYGKLPTVICLQNHGLIITSDNYADIKRVTEEIVIKAEKFSNINLHYYRNTTVLSNLINKLSQQRLITYLVSDIYIKETFKKDAKKFELKPFSPDGYVFCGYKSLAIDMTVSIEEQIKEYMKNFNEVPKILLYDKNIYIVAVDLKKAKMIEDVLKNNLIILNALEDNINFIDDKEIMYLGNWDAEKYRQNL